MWALAHTLFFVLTPQIQRETFLSSVSCNRNLDKSTSFLLTAGIILKICIPKSRGNL